MGLKGYGKRNSGVKNMISERKIIQTDEKEIMERQENGEGKRRVENVIDGKKKRQGELGARGEGNRRMNISIDEWKIREIGLGGNIEGNTQEENGRDKEKNMHLRKNGESTRNGNVLI